MASSHLVTSSASERGMDVSLAAGEEAHISAAAANGGGGDDVTEIRMLLREGTAEVAGVPMSS